MVVVLLLVLTVLILVFCKICHIGHFSERLFNASSVLRNMGGTRRSLSAAPHSMSTVAEVTLPRVISSFPSFRCSRVGRHTRGTLVRCLRTLATRSIRVLRRKGKSLGRRLHSRVDSTISRKGYRRFIRMGVRRARVTQCQGRTKHYVIAFRSTIRDCRCIASTSSIMHKSSQALRRDHCGVSLICVRGHSLTGKGASKTLNVAYPGYNTPVAGLNTGFYRCYKTKIIRLGMRT